MMLNLVVVINGLVLVSMTQSLISSYLCDYKVQHICALNLEP